MFGKSKIKNLENAFKTFIIGYRKFLLKDFKINEMINDRFNSQIESLKGGVRELRRLRDDDLELIASLSYQNSLLKKALHNQRESIMLLMEHFNLYLDIEGDERVVKKEKKPRK